MTDNTDGVTFIRGDDRIRQLAGWPDIAADVAQVRQDMTEADRTHAMGLAALRRAAELTQVELAQRMGVTQVAISRLEQPHDLRYPPSTPTWRPSANRPA